MTVDWSLLPEDILAQVFENHLVSVDDFAMMSCVCRSWHHAATICNQIKMKDNWIQQMPWLMLTPVGALDEDNGDRIVEAGNGTEDLYKNFHLGRNKAYKLYSPQGYGLEYWGSRHGWIVFSVRDQNMIMVNPLTKSRLKLPSRNAVQSLWKMEANRSLHTDFINRVVVLKVAVGVYSYSGGSERLLLVMFYDALGHGNYFGHVAIAKPGDTHWTELERPIGLGSSQLTDVLYHNDLGLLFVSNVGSLVYCKPWEKDAPLLWKWYRSELSDRPDEVWKMPLYNICMVYIVYSGDDVLMILRILEIAHEDFYENKGDCGYRTTILKAYKLDFGTKEWEEMQDLQGIAVFVGNNATMGFQAPGAGYDANSIYFTDDIKMVDILDKDDAGGHDCGIYNLKDKSFKSLCEDSSNTQSSYCRSLWFVPSL